MFEKLYNNFISSITNNELKLKFIRSLTAINVYNTFNKLLEKQRGFTNNEFRNLLILNTIVGVAEKDKITKEKAITIINNIRENSEHEGLIKICNSYLSKFSYMLKGEKAPDFNVGDIRLSDYRGKYLFVNFCNTTSLACHKDIDEMKKIYESLDDSIEFLCIANDTNDSTFHENIKLLEMNWPIARIDENSIISGYRISVIPDYIIIDPKGNVYQYPTTKPREGLKRVLNRILRNKL